jgi:hypothetical protein
MPVPAGALRFNSDSGKLEYYNGEEWWQIDNFSADNATGGARGLFSRGSNASPGNSNVIDYITISTTGNAIDFGDSLLTNRQGTAFSSSTRSLTAGTDTTSNVIDFVTISSTGNGQDFGDLVVARNSLPSSCSNSTRGLVAGGATPTATNAIDYLTIASTGTNAQDFGDLTEAKSNSFARSQSSTRGIFAGNRTPAISNIIEFVTISTLGNAADFGDLSVARGTNCSADNSVRGVFAGGYNPGATNTIDYITTASLGNAIDFGDLLNTITMGSGGTSSPTRGVFALGYIAPALSNVIQYVQLMSTGNSVDFGDLTEARNQAGASSNGHGGL